MRRPPNIWIALGILYLLLLAHGMVWRVLAPFDPGLMISGRPWAALLALAGTAGLPTDCVRLFLGGLAGAVILAVALDLAGRMEGPGDWAGLVGPALLVLSPPVARGILNTPEIALFAAVLLLAIRRTFDETGTPGALALSALPWALIGAWCQQGIILLVAAFVHRLLYVRRFRPGRAHWVAITVWQGASVIGAVVLLVVFGGWSGGPFSGPANINDYSTINYSASAAPGPSGIVAPVDPAWSSWHLWSPVVALWRTVRGLALLPFLLVFWLAWKPRPVWYLAVLALVISVVWTVVLGWRPPPVLAAEVALLPMLPLFYVVLGEAFRAGRTVLEAGGFRGRQSAIVTAIYLLGLALATVWPTLTLLAQRV